VTPIGGGVLGRPSILRIARSAGHTQGTSSFSLAALGEEPDESPEGERFRRSFKQADTFG
jgi:hypothetical protein